MSNINKKLFNRLHLNHAYGQLIALIFVPIMILACVGALLVITETSNAAKAQQRQSVHQGTPRVHALCQGAECVLASASSSSPTTGVSRHPHKCTHTIEGGRGEGPTTHRHDALAR